ncbi:MAG: PocR ligand-binding domain-containing protein, partial [Verrucomicrobiia bacterium]
MSVMPLSVTTHFKSPRATEAEAFGAWRQVMQLPVACEYQTAFQSATGLRLRFLDAVGMADMERVSGPFCGLAGPNNARPVSCPRKVRLLQRASFDDGTVICVCCIAAVTEVVVPVLMGQCHVGSVVVGPFCLRAPTTGDHHTLAARWRERNPGANPASLRKHDHTLRALPVANAKRYRAAMVLARTFAQYLTECGNRMLLESATRRS